MKITKDAKHEYEKNNVSKNSGYTNWFHKSEVTRVRIGAVILSYVSVFVLLLVCEDTIRQSFLVPMGIFEGAIFFGGGVLLLIFIVPLLWRIFQLAIASKGKLDEKCIIKLNGNFTCIYNEKLTRERALACLIVPGVVFILLFSVLMVLTDGVQKTFFAMITCRLIIYLIGDIGSIWCLIRHTKKKDIIFGEYKKTQGYPPSDV